MLSVPYNLIVVGATEKSFGHKLVWTIPKFMDSEEKQLSVAEGGKGEAGSSKEPVIEIFKTTGTNYLPSVHSSIAAASPIFNSYRSVFQNWKHSVPKLYKYPSSDIEVVVYRKNGEVEKLSNSNHTNSLTKKYNDDHQTVLNVTTTMTESSDLANYSGTKEPATPKKSGNTQINGTTYSEGNFTDDDDETAINLLETELTRGPLKTQHSSVSTACPLELVTTDKCIYQSSHVITSKSTLEDDLSLPEVDCDMSGHHVQWNHKIRPNCKFIFNAKTRLLSSFVPSKHHLRTNSTDSCVQTVAFKNPVDITETKATQTQPSHDELIKVIHKNVESQCNMDRVELISKYSQNAMETRVHLEDFSQIFPILSDANIQTDKFAKMVTSSYTQATDLYNSVDTSTSTHLDKHERIDVSTQSEKPFKIQMSSQTCQPDRINVSSQTPQLEHIDVSSQTRQLEMIDVSSQISKIKIDTDIVCSSTQTEELKNPTSSSFTQTLASENIAAQTQTTEEEPKLERTLHTVEWHNNVPCCNSSDQTDPAAFNLVKDNFCQAEPNVTSKSSQVEADVEQVKEAATNTIFETKDAEIQLSASCCYFTKRRARKHYEIKLDALRKEIRSFYRNKRELLDQCNVSTKGQGGRGSNTPEDPNMPMPDCNLENNGNTTSSAQTLEETTKYLDELGMEVEKLLGNASLLKSNLDSLDDVTYFEDEYLLSSN